MAVITKIKLCNFRKFRDFSIFPDKKINIFIGDNEAGKSTILSAIDLVLSGSRNKIEKIGLESLLNYEAVCEFINSSKKIQDLPVLFVELYLDEQNNPNLNGRINSEGLLADGLRLICEPSQDFSSEISSVLRQSGSNFPFEYYSLNFKTFSGESYTGYRKFIRHVFIDNSQISNDYAMRDYIKTMYDNEVKPSEKNMHQYEYRKYKEKFKEEILSSVNQRINDYAFSLKTGSKENLDNDLTISEGDINIENKGNGRLCFIKTDFALKKKTADKKLDIVLLEEPENHLSHINMKRLISRISEIEERQLFIATHNNLISTRLDLRNSFLLNSNTNDCITLSTLSDETSKFFMKAPDNNVLEYILSKKVVLVEGNAEYILMELFFNKITGQKPEDLDIHIISVGGTSFKRYLELAKLLDIRTAVIRDNDGDYQNYCIDNYVNFTDGKIKIFSEKENNKYTFEIVMYTNNQTICDELFSSGRKSLSVQEYMLKNKADVAFELLDKNGNEITVPSYIRDAIEWIRL